MAKFKKFNFVAAFMTALVMVFSLNSCSSDDSEGGGGSKELTLHADETSVFINDLVTFTVTIDGTEEKGASLYANGTLISNPKAFEEAGIYKVVAKKAEHKDSPEIIIKVQATDGGEGGGEEEEPVVTYKGYEHRVLLEDFTGTWCGPCSTFLTALGQLETRDTDNKVVIAAIHCGDRMEITPSFFPFYKVMKKKIEDITITDRYSIPFAIINRNVTWGFPPTRFLDQPIDLAKESSPIGISFTSQLGETTGTIKVDLAFEEDHSDLKYMIYVLEDDIIDTQVGFTGNYNHMDVVKATVGNFTGLAIPAENTKADTTFESTSHTVKYKKANVAKLRVAVAVLDKDGNVLNVQEATANTTKDFVRIAE